MLSVTDFSLKNEQKIKNVKINLTMWCTEGFGTIFFFTKIEKYNVKMKRIIDKPYIIWKVYYMEKQIGKFQGFLCCSF